MTDPNPEDFLTRVRVSRVDDQYPALVRNNRLRASDLRRMRDEVSGFGRRPRLSLVLLVGGPDRLERTLDSVMGQVYPDWELRVRHVPTGKRRARVAEERARGILARYGRLDERIEVESGGRSARETLNAAISGASGELVGFLDPGDELSPDALFEVARLLQAHPGADLVYTDEDVIDELGQRSEPRFKPGWSPDLLLSTDYVSRLSLYRTSLLEEIGGFAEELEGVRDYDLTLRFTERTANVHRVPKVLYHRRESRSFPPESRRVLSKAVERRGIEGSVESGRSPGTFRIKPRLRDTPKVSIVMPTGGRIPLLSKCLESIESRTTYPNYEVLVVDNSDGSEVAGFLSSGPHRVVRFEGDFDFSSINNLGVSEAEGEYVVLLNDDTEIISGGWLEEMLLYARRPEVGAVGVKLLYPEGDIQHAGVVTGIGEAWEPGIATHSHIHYPADAPGYLNAVDTVRNYSAVTAACLMLRKSVFDEVGGFDAENLPVAFQDVDLCLKMRERGYFVVYTPYAELYHHEGASKGRSAPREEVLYMRERWGAVLDADPYYNEHFSTGGRDFELRADLLRPRALRTTQTTEGPENPEAKRSSRSASLAPARKAPARESFDPPGSPSGSNGGFATRRSVRAEQIIWMFGSSRTGSTWLSRIMAELEDQERWHEPYVGLLFGFFLYRRIKDEKLLNSPTFIMGEPYREAWLGSVKDFVLDGAAARYPGLREDQYLVIKEPNGSIGAPLLMQATPESRMIFLIRDPRDVVASRIEGFREGGWAVQVRDYATPEKLMDHTRQLAEDYLTVVSKVQEAYAAHDGPKAFVRYEELRADTLGTLTSMYDSLEMEVDRTRLQAAILKHDWERIPETERGAGKFYRKARPGSWEEDLSAEQIELVENVTAPILQRLYGAGH